MIGTTGKYTAIRELLTGRLRGRRYCSLCLGLIGEREIIREQITKSTRPNEWLASRSVAQHHVTESAVLASEIKQIPDLHGFLKFASTPEWKRVQLPLT